MVKCILKHNHGLSNERKSLLLEGKSIYSNRKKAAVCPSRVIQHESSGDPFPACCTHAPLALTSATLYCVLQTKIPLISQLSLLHNASGGGGDGGEGARGVVPFGVDTSAVYHALETKIPPPSKTVFPAKSKHTKTVFPAQSGGPGGPGEPSPETRRRR